MSVNLSVNLSFSNKFKKADPTEEEAQKKKNGAKQNPLLNAKTDPYVDDNEAFQPRISRADKYEYWRALLPNKGARRPLPKAFISWKSKEIADVNEEANYSRVYLYSFNFIRNGMWDQRFLNLFIVFLVLVVFFVDKWADSLAPSVAHMNAGNQIIVIPPILMFLTQLIPCLGMMYFVSNGNDLVHFRAVKEMGSWALVAVLTAQYVEFFYYRGQGHPERAGNCKIGHDPNPRPVLNYMKNFVNTLRRRNHAKVNSEMDDKTQEEDEEDAIKDIEAGQGPKSALKKAVPLAEPDDDKGNNAGKDKTRSKGKSSKGGGSSVEESDAVGGGGSSDVKQKPRKNSRKKSSATISADAIAKDDALQEARRKSEIIDFDADGNEIKTVPIQYTDWTCVVCKTQNHAPTHGPVESDIWFGEKGVYYKRTYAVIQARRDVPVCKKCGTYADYVPPLGSAHLFAHNPDPHAAFHEYPKPSTVQAGLKPDIYSRYYYYMKGFFLGIKDDINSAPLKNDWRLEKFVNNRFPELPRYVLKPGELFQVGEIVECKQQKFAWARARILKAHKNHTYDIRYDPGDELRFVVGSAIRTIPEKRAYAFRVEMGLVLIAILSPLGMALGLMSGNIGLCMIGTLIVSAGLLLMRIVVFVQYFYNYYHAGMIAIAKLSAVYMLPLLFLMIASAVAVGSGGAPGAWMSVAILLILTEVFTLPVLYIYRPPYLVIGAIVFSLSSLGLVVLAMYAANPASLTYIAVPLAPFLILALFLKLLRANLHNIWDVSLIIRKAKDTEFENPSILGRLKDTVMDYIDP